MTGYRITYTDPAGERQEKTCRELADVMTALQDLRASGATRLSVERGRGDLSEADDVRTAPKPKRGGWCW